MGRNKVLIINSVGFSNHSTSWTNPWVDYCKDNSLEFEMINSDSPNIISIIKQFDVVLWHFSGYLIQDMIFARSILYTAKSMGLKVFPDLNDCWHFDDKVAETFLLQSIEAPIPQSNVFLSKDSAVEWLEESAQFPLIAKLRNGSGSHNVKLLSNKEEAFQYVAVMFGKGLSSSPSLKGKAKANIQSTKSLKVFVSRLKRIPEFIQVLKKAKQFSNEKDYVNFQEYIPNKGFDLKIVVVGDKLSFIGRNIRKGDFRASGGGSLFYDKSVITKNIIESAFETSDKLGFKCMGYDYVVDESTGIGKIIEISYGFSHTALMEAGGYFNRKGEWIEEPLNAPREVIKNLLDA